MEVKYIWFIYIILRDRILHILSHLRAIRLIIIITTIVGDKMPPLVSIATNLDRYETVNVIYKNTKNVLN